MTKTKIILFRRKKLRIIRYVTGPRQRLSTTRVSVINGAAIIINLWRVLGNIIIYNIIHPMNYRTAPRSYPAALRVFKILRHR
ncbi:hypothetical protein AMJ86_07630 [bacterium SM23_57]|nr:MAG: hypothetical protein AMJ86_07630 [bacterium SM23_57]